MSGGSMNYAFLHVQEAALRIKCNTDHRARFRAHLSLVVEALRAIEWTDSDDGSPEDEVKAIERVFKAGTW